MERLDPTLHPHVPDGWFAKESVTLLAPDGQANIIISSEPLDPSIDTDTYAEVQGELLRKEFPGYRQLGVGVQLLPGARRVNWRNFSWTPPDGVAVTQLQIYYVQCRRGYTATATTPSTSWSRFEPVFHRVLETLEIAQPTAS